MLPFKLLYRDVDSLEVSNLDKEFIKSRLSDSAFLSYNHHRGFVCDERCHAVVHY